MSNLQTLPKGDSAWLFHKAIQRIIQQISVLETNIGSSTTGNSSNTQIIFNDNGVLRGDTGLTYNATTDLLSVASATITGDLTVKTNVLKVDTTNNRVGVVKTTPLYPLDVGGRISYSTGIGEGADLTVSSSGTSLQIGLGSSWTQQLFYLAGSEAMRLNSAGMGVGVTPSAGKGCLQLSSGINFPATQVASSDANTLDDYEEGTWTGTLKGSVSDPTVAVTATGRYTKIGRLVHVSINFANVSTVGASGNISITGLPFASANDGVGAVGAVGFYLSGTFTGSPASNIIPNSSVIDLFWSQSNGVNGNVTHNAGVGRYINATIVYYV
jgi:hypothetical protein